MKNKVGVMVFAFLAMMMLVLQTKASALPAAVITRQAGEREEQDFAEREEVHQNYHLVANTRVEVVGINGPVEIETGVGTTAEVHIVRSARTREELAYHRIIVEHTLGSLMVRGERESERDRENSRQAKVRQRVRLVLPRQVDLTTRGVNGRLRVGEIDGPVRVSGINGAVEVAHAASLSELSGINGSVGITIKELGASGMRISGINGRIELRFMGELNADLSVSGINGQVSTELPNVALTEAANVTLQSRAGKLGSSNFRARIGAGGAPITISGVNGSLRLTRATIAAAQHFQ